MKAAFNRPTQGNGCPLSFGAKGFSERILASPYAPIHLAAFGLLAKIRKHHRSSRNRQMFNLLSPEIRQLAADQHLDRTFYDPTIHHLWDYDFTPKTCTGAERTHQPALQIAVDYIRQSHHSIVTAHIPDAWRTLIGVDSPHVVDALSKLPYLLSPFLSAPGLEDRFRSTFSKRPEDSIQISYFTRMPRPIKHNADTDLLAPIGRAAAEAIERIIAKFESPTPPAELSEIAALTFGLIQIRPTPSKQPPSIGVADSQYGALASNLLHLEARWSSAHDQILSGLQAALDQLADSPVDHLFKSHGLVELNHFASRFGISFCIEKDGAIIQVRLKFTASIISGGMFRCVAVDTGKVVQSSKHFPALLCTRDLRRAKSEE